MRRVILRSVVGIAILGSSLWLGYFFLWTDGSADGSPQVPSTPDDPGRSTAPDLRLGGATITEFDETGRLKYRLRAKEMSRYEATTETALTDPTLLIHSASGAPWKVESRTGKISESVDRAGEVEQVVLLREDVVLRQLDKLSGHEVLVIRSAAIDLFPARQFAKSLASVMIDSDVGRTQAASMEGDLKTGQLHLSSDAEQPVHSIVLPTQFKSSK
jgi:LPS export ABC transporter protein LptC